MGSGTATGHLPSPVKVNVPFTSSGETSMYVGKDFYAPYVQVRCIVGVIITRGR